MNRRRAPELDQEVLRLRGAGALAEKHQARTREVAAFWLELDVRRMCERGQYRPEFAATPVAPLRGGDSTVDSPTGEGRT